MVYKVRKNLSLMIKNMVLLLAFVDSIVLWYLQRNHLDFVIELLMNLSLVLLIILCKPINFKRRVVMSLIYCMIIIRFMLLLVSKFSG
ncbi:MAG: hypothetical protein EU981_04485 [Candidatus Liberibacter ctenarytainae]|uniref:Uncharacterized protein n=1 Tax=Candidatus Liberibacter ctenarytainae TaxID=2020335 RepID=A0A937DJD3_9HYPH|nr:hypothetical protein [Candidatus Liberibacter ctenarytainae]